MDFPAAPHHSPGALPHGPRQNGATPPCLLLSCGSSVSFSCPVPNVSVWANHSGPTLLSTVVDEAPPTVLVGVSGQRGLFTEPIVRSRASTTPQPIILPLSNPTNHAEALPDDLLVCTNGTALIATGSPFDDVAHNGVTHHISQANNVYVFPGLGLGTLASGATMITDSMLLAAARAVADQSPCDQHNPDAGILPPTRGPPHREPTHRRSGCPSRRCRRCRRSARRH